ncbi:leucine-, glutamate- and lysine-rich protein 1-like [Salarias fasciatus]|uniref:leucine-, glutamate- and lysine-rich protein 1-like n=1 Tax=Salarias fasciatus TaxID=181472 RepID=UPI00117703F3|nr:leucine-, glutamate- and lysine-rich protein 1 [Salarias fasciatus]
MRQKYRAAVEEATQGRKVLERSQQETTQLRKERDLLIESHGRALTKMKEDFRQQLATKVSDALKEQRSQNALYLKEQMEKFRREVELELSIDMEKNQLLLQHWQRENSQLQKKLKEKNLQLQDLHDELLQEKSSMEEQRRTQDERVQQEALQLSQAKTEVDLLAEENTELHQEVALLQEAVRRECEEREELTAALSRAQQELCERRSRVSHQGASGPRPDSIQRPTARGQKNFHLHSQPRAPLTRSPASPNTLRHSPPGTDKDGGRGTDGGEAERNAESRKSAAAFGEDKRREETLPRLKASEVKHKVSTVTTRKDKV